MNQTASVYVRQQGIAGVQLYDGWLTLERAHEVCAAAAADECGGSRHSDYKVLYYEVRGLGECAVRYRMWIERPSDYVRTEVLIRRSPGRRSLRNIAENK